MAPKPRPEGKPPSPSKDNHASSKPASLSMPPPPVPNRQPEPLGLLVPESLALSNCLKSASIKVGKIYGFYADAKRLGISRYASAPPRSLIASLGRDVEQYDQLCDAVQSHLQRAILVLKRDLARAEAREEARKKKEAEEAAAKAAAEAAAKAAAEAEAAAAAAAKEPSPPHSPSVPEAPPASPVDTITSQKGAPLRRLSGVYVSSLSRSRPRPMSLHVDLPPPGMPNPDENDTLQSGLASPVTLAPKSSIPRMAPDFPFPDIDLTVGDDDSLPGSHRGSIGGDPTLGSSADKPIDLDLDIGGYFDTGVHAGNTLQPPIDLAGPSDVVHVKEEDHAMDLEFLKSLQGDEGAGLKDDILAGIEAAALRQQDAMGATNADPTHDLLAAIPPNSIPSDIQLGDTASPGSLLAGLEAAANGMQGQGDASAQPLPSGGETFDFDLNGLLSQGMEGVDMSVFNMETTHNENGSPPKPS